MLAILPIALSELSRAHDYLSWLNELGGCHRHKLLILGANPVPMLDLKALAAKAELSFHLVQAIRQHTACELPWPKNANAMFRCACEYVQSRSEKEPWLWLELDAIATRSGWLNEIEDEYRKSGKMFLGCIFDKPQRHMNGVAVYPATLSGVNPWMAHATDKPFDLIRPYIAIERGHATKLIVRSLANPSKNQPHTFPDKASLSIVPKTCVLFHGNKDQSLIKRLREQREEESGPVKFPARNPSSIPKSTKAFIRKLEFAKKYNLPRPKLKLPAVTIWAASWSTDKVMQERTIRVMRYCDKIIKPAEIIFFSYMPVPKGDNPFRVIPIPELDWQKWNVFVNRTVPKFIKTEHALAVHEDGFPICLDCWDNEFLKWDYTGAIWQDGVVGNGLNLESNKLMQIKLNMPIDVDEDRIAADMYLCRNRRKYLEDKGVKFAPRDVAMRFSTELVGSANWPSFCFHGRVWSLEKYKMGWKLIEESEK